MYCHTFICLDLNKIQTTPPFRQIEDLIACCHFLFQDQIPLAVVDLDSLEVAMRCFYVQLPFGGIRVNV